MNKKKKIDKDQWLPSIKETFNIIKTFTLVMFTFILFRAENTTVAFDIITKIFSKSIFEFPIFRFRTEAGITLIFIVFLIVVEWIGRNGEYGIAKIFVVKPRIFRWVFYYFILLIVFLFAAQNQRFIYFQF